MTEDSEIFSENVSIKEDFISYSRKEIFCTRVFKEKIIIVLGPRER